MMKDDGRPFGQPALVASLPEPVSAVSAHTGDGQAQGCDPNASEFLKLFAELSHPKTGIMRGIYGPQHDKDGKLIRIRVGELRKIDRCIGHALMALTASGIDAATAVETGNTGSIEDESPTGAAGDAHPQSAISQNSTGEE